MEHEYTTTMVRLSLSLIAGTLIGLERTFHGRPAGIRTHTLVCLSSTLLMLLSVFQWQLLAGAPIETIRVDPTRMAQGIMTGIGFLGAGVILKESLTIRGLTTAASIWLTASVGVVIGMGLYFAAFLTLLIALLVLILFRHIEHFLPTQQYGHLSITFSRQDHLNEADLRQLIKAHHSNCFDLSYRLENEGKSFVYEMTINTLKSNNFELLSETLIGMESVKEYSLQLSGK